MIHSVHDCLQRQHYSKLMTTLLLTLPIFLSPVGNHLKGIHTLFSFIHSSYCTRWITLLHLAEPSPNDDSNKCNCLRLIDRWEESKLNVALWKNSCVSFYRKAALVGSLKCRDTLVGVACLTSRLYLDNNVIDRDYAAGVCQKNKPKYWEDKY